MKKIISIILCVIAVISLFSSCSSPDAADDGKLKIVATVFPQYDWVKNILGDRSANADLTLLLDSGVDLHSFQPTADDLVKISSCDMFIYVGGESDEWVDDALAQAVNKDMTVINLLEVLGESAKDEEIKEGMQAEEEEEEGGEEAEKDEHVWLSLKNAAVLCGYIAGKLGGKDPEGRAVYSANADAYIEKLNALDSLYKSAVDGAANKTLLFCDRFPFRYLADDYGLDYYAAFAGCSAESEASFETITFLAGKLKTLGLKNVVVLEGGSGKIASTVISTSGLDGIGTVTLNSMQSVTAQDIENGADYIDIMTQNLEGLKTALS
ncbi:MAG: zinc ABC transporter substrate-binding protein [Clostridia bacterium]|nr:zinc ABC transporter substrate-binding protein [Clostridia bacterium]